MNKLIILFLLFIFVIPLSVQSQIKVELNLAGDVYYATDNEKDVGLAPRTLSEICFTNPFKDRIGTNNVLLSAKTTDKLWRTNFAIAHFGDGSITPEEANIGLNLIQRLWLEGGYYACWDVDYTYDKWFTETSLTELRIMASPYLSLGVSYEFTNETSLRAGIMNNAFTPAFPVNTAYGSIYFGNLTKSIYAKFTTDNLYKDCGLTVSFLTGNVNDTKMSEIFLKLQGHCIDKLESQLMVKYFIWSPRDLNSKNLLSIQLQGRYHFIEKFTTGLRFAYTYNEERFVIPGYSGLDIGVVCEYNPTPFTYLRLEGGMLSFFNTDGLSSRLFWDGNKIVDSRMSLALSMGFKFGLFHTEIK